MSGRRGQRPPDDPLMEEMSRLAKEHGDTELLRVCLLVVTKYADLGARQALTARKGDRSIECPVCRERAAAVKQLEQTLNRVSTGRPIGGAAPNSAEEV